MVWSIPFIFKAGQKAKANEVNDNFASVKGFVDVLEDNLGDIETNVAILESNKANVNGDMTQRFQVANPSSAFDALNLQTFQDMTKSYREVISGFTPSKAANNVIAVTGGSCWDSTFVYQIIQDTSLTCNITGLGANQTYYLYVVADKDTSTNQIVYNASPSVPLLPGGYEYYRRIGSFTTDGDGNVDTVLSEGETGDSNSKIGFIGSVIGTAAGDTTLTENRWLYVSIGPNTGYRESKVTINGVEVLYYHGGSNYGDGRGTTIPCQKGQRVVITGFDTRTWLRMV